MGGQAKSRTRGGPVKIIELVSTMSDNDALVSIATSLAYLVGVERARQAGLKVQRAAHEQELQEARSIARSARASIGIDFSAEAVVCDLQRRLDAFDEAHPEVRYLGTAEEELINR